MTGESHVADLPLLFRAIERLDHAARLEVMLRIVIVDAFVHLPEVEIIRSQPSQRLLELPHRHFRVAPVRADLRHQENRFTTIFDRATHPLFAFAVVIFPGVVQEVDTRIDRGVNNPHRFGHRIGFAKMISAEADDGDEVWMASERAAIDGQHFHNISLISRSRSSLAYRGGFRVEARSCVWQLSC